MTITREIDGKTYTFTLTANERYSAYYEQQAAFDREDMETAIDALEAELEELGIVRQEALSRLDALGDKYREALDYWYSANIDDYTDIAWNVLENFFGKDK